MAVCLEEARDHNHCTIRLTSNTGDLDEVVDGFKLMARILANTCEERVWLPCSMRQVTCILIYDLLFHDTFAA
jgi:hypothetical protein